MQTLKERLNSVTPQEWLELRAKEMSGKVVSVPNMEQVDNQINTQLIVEHYSRI
jgi:ribosomal protein S4